MLDIVAHKLSGLSSINDIMFVFSSLCYIAHVPESIHNSGYGYGNPIQTYQRLQFS